MKKVAEGDAMLRGFRMPAEWEPHVCCWMGWPCPMRAFVGRRGLEEARAAFANIAGCIAEFEPVRMLARPQDAAAARQQLGNRAEVVECPMDDSWLRDSGPTFVVNDKNGEVGGVAWQFNAWGNKYPCKDDIAVGGRVLQFAGVRRFDAPLVMEGGSFHADGEGALLTTEQCLLHPNRNPQLSRREIEKHLRDCLGAKKIVWLVGDLRDDETDGHVDNVACFVRPGHALAMRADGDKTLGENARRLQAAEDASGRRLEITFLPRPQMREHGRDLLASYINFYLPNGGVVMPSFGIREDDEARVVIAEMFPNRRVLQTPALAVVRGGGGIHCITQQQPAPPAKRDKRRN